jgi:hypothetical protein
VASERIIFRVDDQLGGAIRAAAEARGQGVSEYLRDLAAYAPHATTPAAKVDDVRSLSASDLVLAVLLDIHSASGAREEMLRRAAGTQDERDQLLAALIAFVTDEPMRGRPRVGGMQLGLYQLAERSAATAAAIAAGQTKVVHHA